MRALAAALLLILPACSQAPPDGVPGGGSDRRITTIERGIALRHSDPLGAARLLRDAGPGADLESIRLDVWFRCLEDGGAPAEAWREYLDQRPDSDSAEQARLVLARLLATDGAFEAAEEILGPLSGDRAREADRLRLSWPADHEVRIRAARRLALTAPAILRDEARELEEEVVAGLSVQERVDRAVAWRRSGHPRTAAGELRRLRARGADEGLRRVELARAELVAGSTSRALGALPSLSRASGEEALLRAEAWRNRGWGRFPSAGARRAFDECLSSARRARTADGATRIRALELELECATEAGRLDIGVAAWRDLMSNGWDGRLRSWLGRRLGVALALEGGRLADVEVLRTSLPDHERCLRFWAAGGDTGRIEDLADLPEASFPDLYALWVREDLGWSGPRRPRLGDPVAVLAPPETVARLIALGETGLASVEWRRLRWGRGVLPGEAVAAAEFEFGRGREDLAIRWLRRAFPDLGGIAMERAPENALRAYLPLKWTRALRQAAAEFGLEPWLLAGLARQESIFNADARSPAGAVGLVQLMRGTARGHARALGLGNDPDRRDPAVNLRLGARELSWLISRFGAVEPALAAYNAGESRVRRWWRVWPDARLFSEKIPISETYTYVRRVRFLAEAYRVVWAEEWDEGSIAADLR